METSCGRVAPVLILSRVKRGLSGRVGKSGRSCREETPWTDTWADGGRLGRI